VDAQLHTSAAGILATDCQEKIRTQDVLEDIAVNRHLHYLGNAPYINALDDNDVVSMYKY
jgi:hypothetical protein